MSECVIQFLDVWKRAHAPKPAAGKLHRPFSANACGILDVEVIE